MNQVAGPGPQQSVLAVLRQAIRQTGFREGLIVASRHDGRISKVKVCGTARGDGRPASLSANGSPQMSVEELAQLFLHQLDLALRHWAFRYGKFKFRVAGMDVVHTTFSVSIRPQEEELMVSLCRGASAGCE